MYNWHDNEKKLMDAIDIKSHIGLYHSVHQDACLCPFHDDHDPSLKISSKKQIAKCFVCGWSGNVVRFHMDQHQMNKVKAMQDLSNQYGITIDTFDQQKSNIDFSFANVYTETKGFLHYYLKHFKPAINYMLDRGITQDVINKFSIGICPKNNKLSEFLSSKFTSEEYLKTDLFYNDGKVKYGSRIMIPLQDFSNQHTIGFAGRLVKYIDNKFINDDSNDKYINPYDSYYVGGYKKESYIYGYYFAKSFNDIHIVEGYMDVLAMHSAGIENVVSIGGTAMTTKQFDLLSNKSLILAFDTDKSGVAAALKYTKTYHYYPFKYTIFKNKDANDSLKDGKIIMHTTNLFEYIKYVVEKDIFVADTFEKQHKLYYYLLDVADSLDDEFLRLSIRKYLLEYFKLN